MDHLRADTGSETPRLPPISVRAQSSRNRDGQASEVVSLCVCDKDGRLEIGRPTLSAVRVDRPSEARARVSSRSAGDRDDLAPARLRRSRSNLGALCRGFPSSPARRPLLGRHLAWGRGGSPTLRGIGPGPRAPRSPCSPTRPSRRAPAPIRTWGLRIATRLSCGACRSPRSTAPWSRSQRRPRLRVSSPILVRRRCRRFRSFRTATRGTSPRRNRTGSPSRRVRLRAGTPPGLYAGPSRRDTLMSSGHERRGRAGHLAHSTERAVSGAASVLPRGILSPPRGVAHAVEAEAGGFAGLPWRSSPASAA